MYAEPATIALPIPIPPVMRLPSGPVCGSAVTAAVVAAGAPGAEAVVVLLVEVVTAPGVTLLLTVTLATAFAVTEVGCVEGDGVGGGVTVGVTVGVGVVWQPQLFAFA